jgi:hypothetical protein
MTSRLLRSILGLGGVTGLGFLTLAVDGLPSGDGVRCRLEPCPTGLSAASVAALAAAAAACCGTSAVRSSVPGVEALQASVHRASFCMTK